MGDDNSASCPGPLLVDTAALAFDLLGAEIAHAPRRLESVLKSKEFAQAVERGFKAEAQRLLQQQTVSRNDSEKVLGNLLESSANATADVMKRKIQSTGRYRRLEADAKAVTKAMKCRAANTPIGVWINEHEKKLIVVGVVAVLGAVGTAIYDLRANGADSNTARAGRKLREFVTTNIIVRKVIGTIELLKEGNAVLNFKPSDGSIALDVTEGSGWYSLYAGLAIAGLYNPSESLATSATLSAETKLDKTSRLKSQAKINYKFPPNEAPILDWSVSVGLNRALGGGVNLDFTANLKSAPSPDLRVPEASGMVILQVPF